jgi:hypothetical protein
VNRNAAAADANATAEVEKPATLAGPNEGLEPGMARMIPASRTTRLSRAHAHAREEAAPLGKRTPAG